MFHTSSEWLCRSLSLSAAFYLSSLIIQENIQRVVHKSTSPPVFSPWFVLWSESSSKKKINTRELSPIWLLNTIFFFSQFGVFRLFVLVSFKKTPGTNCRQKLRLYQRFQELLGPVNKFLRTYRFLWSIICLTVGQNNRVITFSLRHDSKFSEKQAKVRKP